MRCCICGEICLLTESYADAPHHLMGIYDSDNLNLRDIDIYYCESCAHTLIPAQVHEEYYDDYSLGSYWGNSFLKVREQQIHRLTSLVTNHQRFLDIGCGVGHYLELAQTVFKEVYGVEPSASSADTARAKGFHIIHDYFHEGLQYDEGFDAISFIEVLEHIEEPIKLLRHAAKLLNDNGIIIIEVPNGQRIVEQRLYNNLCTDHIQYYSIASLTAMAHRAGLTTICVQETANPNLLELYARKVSKPVHSFGETRDIAQLKLSAQLTSFCSVAAWGAGAESACFLAMLKEVKIDCVFDSDKAKHGHTIAGIPICEPTSEHIQRMGQIIIFANSHKQQIEQQLNELGFAGKILTYE